MVLDVFQGILFQLHFPTTKPCNRIYMLLMVKLQKYKGTLLPLTLKNIRAFSKRPKNQKDISAPELFSCYITLCRRKHNDAWLLRHMHTQNLNANSHWIVECTHCWDVVEPHVFVKCFLQVNSINKKIKLKIPFIFRIRLRCSNIYNKRLNFLYSTTLKIYQLKKELEQCIYIYIYSISITFKQKYLL